MIDKRKWRMMISGAALVLTLALFSGRALAESFIVKDGKPLAVIVVPEKPTRSLKFATQELKTYIKKISGAELPVKTDGEVGGASVKIYLGEGPWSKRIGVTDEGLKWGAYRIKSGNDWLALIGKDTDFKPKGIWGKSRQQWKKEGVKEWDAATGKDHHWLNPVGAKMWFKYSKDLDLWSYDEKGTLNAVHGFLRTLGVRWFMPGDLGEIVPEMKTIPLPKIDETVTPNYKIRKAAFSKYGMKRARDDLLWTLRLGVNDPFGFHAYHGMASVTRPEETRKNHPDWYALYNGKRDIDSRTANPCLSSEELLKENVEFVRFMFDHFDVPAISVWPDDGFSAICQCEKCAGKDTPERGRQGVLSDYVWNYVNNVAKEVYKTHPDKLILGGAYSTYLLPPTNIDKLSPNVAVHIVNARRRYNIPEEDLKERREIVRKWGTLSDGKVIAFMNHGGGTNTPNIFAEDIKDLKDASMGEDMWGPSAAGCLANPAFTHLNYYVCSKLWWDPDQDVDKLLDEYYQKFYGPAADEMKSFINYYERNQQNMRNIDSAPTIKKALDLMAAAEKAVDPESDYGKRIAQFSKGLDGKRKFYEKIKDGRQNPPLFEIADVSGEIKIDGNLNESFWNDLPGEFKEIQSGGEVKYPTKFKIGVKGNNLYVGVKCFDEPGNPTNSVKTEKNDDGSMWYGDAVEILLETPEHSYYQIAVNPEGTVNDLDRAAGKVKGFLWGAEATIATSVNKKEGYWTVEAQIPFTPSSQDPLHEVIGPAPSNENPWYFNICRQRIRDEGNEVSAFSPTGKKGFHFILKFGKLVKK